MVGGDFGASEQLDVTIGNRGQANALLKELRLTIEDFLYLPVCVAEGEVGVSAEYELQMPDRPKPGTTVTAVLHDDVPPGEFDRFTVRLKAPKYRPPEGRVFSASFLYHVSLSLESDDGQDLPLGKALLSLPFSPGDDQHWNSSDPNRLKSLAWLGAEAPAVGACLDRNSRSLADFLGLPGERSATMVDLTASVQAKIN